MLVYFYFHNADERRYLNQYVNQPLSPEEEARLQQNYTFLLDEIDGKVLAPTLYEEMAITLDDLERLNSPVLMTRRDRAETLLKIILASEHGAVYDSFIHVLRECGYDHVADRLESTNVQGEY